MTSAPAPPQQSDHPARFMERNGVKGGTEVSARWINEPVQGPIKVGGVGETGPSSGESFLVDLRGVTKEMTQEADRYARQMCGNAVDQESQQARARMRYRRLGELMNVQQQAPQQWGQPYQALNSMPPPPANWGNQPPFAPGYPPQGPYPAPIGQGYGYPQPPLVPPQGMAPGYPQPPSQQPVPPRPPGPTPPSLPAPPQISAPSHPVTFHFPGVGPVQVFYHRVSIEKAGLFLVTDQRWTVAPAISVDQLEGPVQVQVAGYEQVFTVEPTGLSFSLDHWRVAILLVVDAGQGG